MNGHCSPSEIQDYVTGVLSPADRHRCEEHFARCRSCRSTLHAVTRIDLALRSIPVERVSPNFTQNVMNRISRELNAPLAFKVLEKLAHLFALFIVLAMLLTIVVVTGVVDVQQIGEGQSVVEQFLSGQASAVSGAIAGFSSWLAEYAPFAFGSGSLGITGAILTVVTLLALLDRFLSRRLIH